MIGPLGNLEWSVLEAFLTRYLPLALIGLVVGGGIGIQVARLLRARVLDAGQEAPAWLSRSPLTPLLVLGGVVLPFLDLPFVAAAALLSLLILPTAAIMALRFYSVRLATDDRTQLRLDQRAMLKASWKDTGMLVSLYWLSGIAYKVLVPDASEAVADHLANMPLAFVLALVGGLILGSAFGALANWLVSYQEKRYARGEYGRLGDTTIGLLQWIIRTLLTQFHATTLTGVLIILGIALPFTVLDQTPVLFALMLPPVTSATLSAWLVDDPDPGQPDEWHHWRAGLSNIAQVSVGYMTGAAMLIPLSLQHRWMLSDSHEVLRQLNIHLELTFYALGISIAVGVIGGILTSRLDVLRTVLINLGNIGRTIPSLAVLALALPIFGVGRDPSLVALVFIGTLPILVNTSVGIIEVLPDIKEAARGMGMNDLQVLLRVEVPIAMPVIMAGIRTSAVLVVASATLAGFIGGGGLGALIIRGDGSGRNDILITGAVLATILAIFLEYFFGWLETLLTPRGLREA